jgi:hypothetical protein
MKGIKDMIKQQINQYINLVVIVVFGFGANLDPQALFASTCYKANGSPVETCVYTYLACAVRPGVTQWAVESANASPVGEYQGFGKCGIRALVIPCGAGIEVRNTDKCPPKV